MAAAPAPNLVQTKRERFDKRLADLRTERELVMPEWRDLADFYVPRAMPWLFAQGSTDARRRRNTKIINTHAVTAARTLKRGMTAGVASPARPWFKLKHPDRDLNDFTPVKLWFHDVEMVLLDLMSRSRFYNCLGTGYGDQGVFGTFAMGIFEDEIDDVRCQTYPIGTYMIATNSRGVADTFYREYRPTVRQIIQQFALEPDGRTINWSRISQDVKTAFENNKLEQRFAVVHVVEPNDTRDSRYADSANLPIRSCYFEPGNGNKSVLLRESGYEERAVLAARWDVHGDEAWGTGPGIEGLGDSKGLQFREKQKSKRIDKHNDPAMVAHPDLKHKRVSLLPGDVTYVGFTPTGGAPLLQPAHNVHHDTSDLREDIESIEQRISRVFDEDLFLMISMSDRREVTAEEIARKYEEKVIMLGPVLERQNDELFDPAIDRYFGIALRRGLLPPAPEELEGGTPLKVEYVSLLAQAQRLVQASTIERYIGFIGSAAKAQSDAGEPPTALDKIDLDQAADEYGAALGVPPTVIRSDEDVEAIREQRSQAAQQQQLAAAADPIAKAAKATKDLGETPVRGRSVLDQMVDNVQAAAE